MEIRRAVDVHTVVDLWTMAQTWLAELGTDQWQYPIRVHAIERAVAAGTCWIAEDPAGLAVATITVDDDADPELWQAEDNPADALYVHRLVVHPEARGGELGSALLDWASIQASQRGKRWLRLDAWTSNTVLHKYYADRGFSLVRIVNNPGCLSGALYQRPSGATRGVGPQINSRPR